MSRPYKSGTYIFPPRPEYKIKSTSLVKYDDNTYCGQPKLNGSCCEIYLDGKTYEQRNRHKGDISNFKMDKNEILSLYSGKGEMVLVGEYMNKSKKDKNDKVFNNKFVIFDILVNDDMYLVGTTCEERYEMLLDTFITDKKAQSYDDYLYQISENVFLVKSFNEDFEYLYNKIITIDMLEGWVLKRKSGKLERGTREKNNVGWSIKVRKQCNMYNF